ADIVIPLWSEGTIWWDVRDANYCLEEGSGRLTLIDTDSLAAYLDEILHTPSVWQQRDKGRLTALARLRQMTPPIGRGQGRSGGKKVQTAFTTAWQAEMEPALLALGREPAQRENAVAALERVLQRLEETGLLWPVCLGTHCRGQPLPPPPEDDTGS